MCKSCYWKQIAAASRKKNWSLLASNGTLFLPAATKLGQGNVFTGVCDSVNRGGGVSPRSRHPPGADTPEQTHPPEQTPPWSRHPPGSRLQHTVYERPVRILLECILVGQVSSLSFSKESLVVPSIIRCSKLLKYTEIMKRKVHLVTLIFPGTLRKIDFPGAPEKGSFEVRAVVKGYRGGQKHDKSG